MGSINTSFGSPAKLVTKWAHMLQMAAYTLRRKFPRDTVILIFGTCHCGAFSRVVRTRG